MKKTIIAMLFVFLLSLSMVSADKILDYDGSGNILGGINDANKGLCGRIIMAGNYNLTNVSFETNSVTGNPTAKIEVYANNATPTPDEPVRTQEIMKTFGAGTAMANGWNNFVDSDENLTLANGNTYWICIRGDSVDGSNKFPAMGDYSPGNFNGSYTLDDGVTWTDDGGLYASIRVWAIPISTPTPALTYHTVHVNNLYNDTDLSGVNVSFYSGLGAYIGYNLTDSDGNATWWNYTAAPNLSFNASRDGFFNYSGGTVAVNTTEDINLSRGSVNITSIVRKIDNTVLGAALGTWTVNTSGGKTYNECGATYPCNIYLTRGVNNLTLQYSGAGDYYDRHFTINITNPEDTTTTVTGVYDNQHTVLAQDINSAAINTYNVTVNNTALSYEETLLTTTGTLTFNLVQGYNYTFVVRPAGYEYKNETTNVSLATTNTVTKHYFKNSISIAWYNEETGVLINDRTIYIELISDSDSANYTTSNGTLETEILSPDSYTLRYTALGYMDAFYSFTITDNYHYFLNLTMLNDTSGANVTIYVYDTLGNRVEDAYVTVTKYDVVDNDFDVTEILRTNFEGRTIANIILNNEYYKFIVAYEGRTVLTTTPTYVYGTEITLYITITDSGLEDYFTQSTLYGSINCNNNTHLCTFNYNDLDGVATQGCVYAYRLTSTETLYNSSCSGGSAGTAYITLSNVSGSYYRVKGYITKAGSDFYVAEYLQSYKTTAPEGGTGLFMLFFLELIIIGIAFWRLWVAIALFGVPPFLFSILGIIQIPIAYTIPVMILSFVVAYLLRK